MTPRHPPIFTANLRRRRGFSFAEIMFAVMILGIGFIMVAGIFPVAIQQQQATVEATVGKQIARNGAEIISGSNYMTAAMLPNTEPVPAPPSNPASAFVSTFHDTTGTKMFPSAGPPAQPSATLMWDAIKGSLIVPGQERYAFIPLYTRESGQSTADLYVFAVECRNASAFTSADVTVPTSGGEPNLMPKSVTVTVTDGGATGPDTISISGPAAAAAVEGAYVIIADDKVTADNTATVYDDRGYANGRIARLGTLVSSTAGVQTYQLAPGSDLLDLVAFPYESITNADAYLIGRGYTDPAKPASGYSGPSMAIARYVKLGTRLP